MRPVHDNPPQAIPIIRQNEQGINQPALVSWGLLPFRAKDRKIAYNLINARAETLAGKTAFRDAYRKRRCLIPADGLFEWRRRGSDKRPDYIRPRDGAFRICRSLGPLAERGMTVHRVGHHRHHQRQLTQLHDRMPQIVNPELRNTWLQPENDPINDPLCQG